MCLLGQHGNKAGMRLFFFCVAQFLNNYCPASVGQMTQSMMENTGEVAAILSLWSMHWTLHPRALGINAFI